MLFAESPFKDKPAKSKGGVDYKWGDVRPDDLGDWKVTYDTTGMRPIKKVPAPGVHPRIYFGPDELPALRKQLKETESGRVNWQNALAWIHAMKNTYDKNAPYAKPIDGVKGIAGHRVNLMRIGGPKGNGAWEKLSKGDYVYPDFAWSVFPLEAFRCLIENDKAAARKLIEILKVAVKGGQKDRAAGIDHSPGEAKRVIDPDSIAPPPDLPGDATINDAEDEVEDIPDLEEKKKTENKEEKAEEQIAREPPVTPVGGHNLAFCYDFLYNWMTNDERDFFRKEIAYGTDYHAHCATFAEANTSKSNWIPLDSWIPLTLLAIEGEKGFNDLKYKGIIRAWRNFLTYGWHPSGEAWEGRGKSFQFNTTMIAFAKRGDNLLAHPHVRPYGNNLLFHAMQPYREYFLAHDLWGGTGTWYPSTIDAIGLKWAFPNDKRIDWVYRNTVGGDYRRLPSRPDGINNHMIAALVFATDYDKSNDNPEAIANGLHFFCPDRGLMITRSDWSEDALWLTMHTRQDLGAHTFADRNAFALTAKGRVWASTFTHAWSNYNNNVVVIDRLEQDTKTEGRVVDHASNDHASFMTGDASYSWQWHRISSKFKSKDAQASWERPAPVRILNHPNDFRYRPGKSEHLNSPEYGSANWLFPNVVNKPMKISYVNVKHVYRSAGIIRGAHPFALVIDDIAYDGKEHKYEWLMHMPTDIAIQSIKGNDILLYGNNPTRTKKATRLPKKGEPMLLVRVLQCDQSKGKKTKPYIDQELAGLSWRNINDEAAKLRRMGVPPKKNGWTLNITSHSVGPNYKIMLYPYRHGDPLPTTKWNANKTELAVSIGETNQIINMSRDDAGRTQVIIHKDKKELFSLNGKIKPLPDRDGDENKRLAKIRKNKAKEFAAEFKGWTPDSLDGRIKFKWPDLSKHERMDGIVGKAIVFRKRIVKKEAKIIINAPKVGADEGDPFGDDDDDDDDIDLDAKDEPPPDTRLKLPQYLPPYANNAFSICLWVKSKTEDGIIFTAGSGHKGLMLSNHQSRNIRLDACGKHYFVHHPWNPRVWNHFVITNDLKMLKLYGNGKLLGQGKFGSLRREPRNSLGINFTGAIDDLRFYEKALSAEDVKKLYMYQKYIGK
ncbi:MAG: LamG domain-containing protein [Lentisphaeria bacterium]|nr:LamG domain-containing protein [Lentisphaeria bacterium]